jgi:hypothetical protein
MRREQGRCRIPRMNVWLVTLILATSPVVAQTVYVDHDSELVPGSYSTFDWVPTPETSLEDEYPLLHSQIKNAIEYRLVQSGLIQDDTKPELLVTYHTKVAGMVRLDAASYGYDYGPGWVWDPAWGDEAGDYASKVRTYPRGTLIVDIWDMATGRVVWRGTVVGLVPENPDDVDQEIQAALEAMVAKWREMSDGKP